MPNNIQWHAKVKNDLADNKLIFQQPQVRVKTFFLKKDFVTAEQTLTLKWNFFDATSKNSFGQKKEAEFHENAVKYKKRIFMYKF